MAKENPEGKIQFEATVHDVRLHNSKTDDNTWVDLSMRVAGEAGIEAAMKLHRATSKLVSIMYIIGDDD